MTKIFAGAGLAGVTGFIVSLIMFAALPQFQSAAIDVEVTSAFVLLVSLIYCALLCAIPKWKGKGAWHTLYPFVLKFAGFFFFTMLADWILKVPPTDADGFRGKILGSMFVALALSIDYKVIRGQMKGRKSVQKQP